MVEITDWDWKDPQKEMPKGWSNEIPQDDTLKESGNEMKNSHVLVSDKVALIVEEFEFRFLMIARYNTAMGWVFADGNIPLSEAYRDYKVLQWSYLPKPKQEWEEKCEEDLEKRKYEVEESNGTVRIKDNVSKMFLRFKRGKVLGPKDSFLGIPRDLLLISIFTNIFINSGDKLLKFAKKHYPYEFSNINI